jgi:elongation factor Ts
MSISANAVKDLREKTGAGMMDCKHALTEANGDIEKAIEILRKKGIAKAAKRMDRQANEGIIVANISANGTGVLVEVNCETDFVGRNEEFVKFAHNVAEHIQLKKSADLNSLLESNASFNEKFKISEILNELIAKIGEKLDIKRFSIIEPNSSYVVSYIHPGSRLGVLVEIGYKNASVVSKDEFKSFAKDMAMQVAASSPIAINRNEVSKDLVDKEMEIYKEQAKGEKKPEAIAQKIAAGKLEKYYQDIVLTEQAFIKDPSKTVKDIINETNSKVGDNLTIKKFVRYRIGE